MIYSDKQYGISSAQLTKLEDALKSQIVDIGAELAEYDLLKSGQVSFSKTYAIEELPRVLIQA